MAPVRARAGAPDNPRLDPPGGGVTQRGPAGSMNPSEGERNERSWGQAFA